LESDLRTLRDRLDRLERRKANATRDDIQNLDEVAEQHQDDEVIEGVEERTREQVAEIERALVRISNGTWRTCGRCAAPIGAARLQALPTTDCCARCARQAA
jgi:RNA polymerase-binding transcription factor DksA